MLVEIHGCCRGGGGECVLAVEDCSAGVVEETVDSEEGCLDTGTVGSWGAGVADED